MITDRIDGVLIDEDDDGFVMILSGEKAEYRFNVQDVADQILKQAWLEIGPWRNEGLSARAAYDDARRTDMIDTPYAVSDPKHPHHHDVFSEGADACP